MCREALDVREWVADGFRRAGLWVKACDYHTRCKVRFVLKHAF